MLKRLIAFPLAVLLLFAVTVGSVASAEGTETPAPPSGETEAPTPPASETPPVSETPPAGETPVVSKTPVVSETPVISETPAVSVTPEASQTPVASVTPVLIPTPSPTPTIRPYTLTIIARDITIAVNDLMFDINDIAYAVDEFGNKLKVRMKDTGGFLPDVPGTYSITLYATHPLSGEKYYSACTITVEAVEEILDAPEESTLTGTSDSRYRKYQQYRDEVSAQLQTLMQGLNEQFVQRVALLRSAFSDVSTYQMMRQVPVTEETDEADTGAYAVQTELAPMDTPAVSNWSHVLAVFVAASSLDVEEPLDLFNLRKIPLDGIGKVFWDMHDLTFHIEDGELQVILSERSSEEMVAKYGMDADRKARLDELMQPEFQRLFASLTGDTAFMDMTDEEEAAIRSNLPDDLAMQRESVVLTAYSLVGQIKYFWGGKYPHLGWNPLWGVPRVVYSEGSKTTGKVRTFGLDCSGFVTWVFVNAAGDESVAGAIGDGSNNQWKYSLSLGWDEAQPGDLAFRAAPGTVSTNHVGIVVAKNVDGTYLVAHSSSSKNAVVVTEAWSSGFRYMRRPVLYGDA